MGKLVFKLASVSKEEADGVRKALENIEVDFYESPGGSWGWSLPAIWVKHNKDYILAREAIDKYQETYVKKIKESVSPVSQQSNLKIVLVLILGAIVIDFLNSFG